MVEGTAPPVQEGSGGHGTNSAGAVVRRDHVELVDSAEGSRMRASGNCAEVV